MNYINFLQISFCLFLPVSILYPSEKENETKKARTSGYSPSNPLTDEKTYEDHFGHFTLHNAKVVTNASRGTLCTMLHWPEDHVALKWTCSSKNQLSAEDRLQIAKFILQKDTFTSSKKKALLACLRNPERNAEIIKLLQHRISSRNSPEQESSSP